MQPQNFFKKKIAPKPKEKKKQTKQKKERQDGEAFVHRDAAKSPYHVQVIETS